MKEVKIQMLIETENGNLLESSKIDYIFFAYPLSKEIKATIAIVNQIERILSSDDVRQEIRDAMIEGKTFISFRKDN